MMAVVQMAKPSGPSFDQFDPPKVVDAAITSFDDHGLGQEPNNLTAIHSLKGYRSLRWGRNVDLIITDRAAIARKIQPSARKPKSFRARIFLMELILRLKDISSIFAEDFPDR